MKARPPVLGRGLSALIPTSTPPGVQTIPSFLCPIDSIELPTTQPRRSFDESSIRELSESIRQTGILQPLLVARKGDRFHLIAGERRLRAARLAGLDRVPVVVREVADSDHFLLALVENLQREDLRPVEQAQAFRRLIDEYRMTQEDVARRVGKDRSTIANSLRLLKLSAPVIESLNSGEITEGQARSLLPLDEPGQSRALGLAVAGRLNVRETEALVRSLRKEASQPRSNPEPVLGTYFAASREELASATGLEVSIAFRGNRGRIAFSFDSLEEFRSLRQCILRGVSEPQE
jgi:ParB family chromosome partitioning protein